MAGAVDLYAGAPSISGPNLWDIDKNPLNQLSGGVEDMIGEGAKSSGDSIITSFESIIRGILGFAPGIPLGEGGLLLGSLANINQYFGNVEDFLGQLNPMDPDFDPDAAIRSFIETMLHPSHMLAALQMDPNAPSPVVGFIPMANLALSAIAEVVGGAQEVIDAIMAGLGFPQGSATAENVDQVFRNLYDFLANPDLANALLNPVDAVKDFITAMLHPSNLLAPLNPLNLQIPEFNIPGLDATKITSGEFPMMMISGLEDALLLAASIITEPIEAWLLQIVPVSSVGLFNPELLANPHYDDAESVVGGTSGWVWDPTVTHGAGSTGSVKVTANGTILQLLSDPPIPVAPSQILHLQHWLTWAGVVGTGSCFKLGVVAYQGQTISNQVDLATVNNPPASSGWVLMQGDYTVPEANVDNIRLALIINSNATAGTVNWDDGSVKKVQLFWQDFTSGLPGDLENLWTGVNARTLITDFTSLMETIGLGSPTLTAISQRLLNLTSTGTFNAATLWNTNNIPKLLNTSIFGIGGISDIGASLQQTWDNVAGAGLNSGTLAKIATRMGGLNISGFFDASKLWNMLFMPTLSAGSIPILDATKIGTGILDILHIPTDQFDRTTISDLGDIMDEITNAFVGMGDTFLGTDPGQARQSMDSIYREFLGLSQKMQDMRSDQTATNVSGKTVTVNFQEMPDGALPSTFTTTYSGAGTSAIGIKSGAAGWRTQNNNGNRTANIVYNVAPTNTDYQVVRGTLSGAPPGDNGGSKPRIAAIGRVNNPANPTTFVWARGYNDGFLSYKGDIGCTVNGVETVWASNISLTWSMDINFAIGVGGNPRRYQVFSGTQLVKDYTEVGTVSQIGAGFRYWGCRSELKTDSGKAIAPPSIVGTSVSDNQPPDVVGSTFRAYRASTGTANFSGWNKAPNNFFDSLSHLSADMLWDGSSLTVGIEGTYLVNIRYATTNISGGKRMDTSVYRNNQAIRKMGGGFSDSSFGANFGNMFGVALVYCKVNDKLAAGYSVSDTTTVNGEPGGTDTFFEVALMNRSLA